MSEIKVEKGIPIPKADKGRKIGPQAGSRLSVLMSIEVGESIFLEGKTASFAMTVARDAKKYCDHKFTSRTVKGGARIWRIE